VLSNDHGLIYSGTSLEGRCVLKEVAFTIVIEQAEF